MRPHGAHGEGAMTTKPIPEGTRAVLFAEGLMERMFTRTEDGRRLTIEWGEPDEDGFYTPRFTASEDTWYRATAAARDAIREIATGEPVAGVWDGWREVRRLRDIARTAAGACPTHDDARRRLRGAD